MPRLFRIALVILALALAGIFTSVATASSASSVAPTRTDRWQSFVYNYHNYTVPIYICPSSVCQLTNEIPNYAPVNMIYWTDCHWYNGNYSSPRWFYVDYYWDGQIWIGWVHSSYVYRQERTWNWAWNC